MGKQWTGMWLAAALAACGPVEKSGNRGEAPAGGELPGDDGIEVADVRPDHEPTAPGRLQGRLDDDGGYQPAGQLPQGGAIAADRARLVDLQGRVLGEAAIGPDGRFSVGGLTATGEVTLVEVLAAGEPAGQVLVVPGLSVGGDAHTLPVSVETSVEASVYLRLVADGHAVDPIEVAVRVTPAMAAVCDVDGLTRAVWQAHQAFTRTLGSGAALDIAALTSARRRAWGELAVDLDTGHIVVHDVVCAVDVGRVLNRALVTGQVEGAIVQAHGYTISEDLQAIERAVGLRAIFVLGATGD